MTYLYVTATNEISVIG